VLLWRKIILRANSLYRTLRLTQAAVDTLLWVDDKKVGPFVKAVDWADFYTIC
jgi:hypothetical protein